MNETRRTVVVALALAPLGMPFLARAQQLQPGLDYSVLKPEQPVETQGKIEVLEFFWYGCPHCYSLEPLLSAWLKKLPADVEARRVPAVLGEHWAPHALAYYAFEALGLAERLHRPFFDAIHRDRLRIDNPAAFVQWLQRNDVEPTKFLEVMRSFGVQSKVRRATQLGTAYRIDGVPAFAVHGRYTVSSSQGRTQEGLLATVSYLADLTRKELK